MQELITTIGFPAAAFVAMFKLYREERQRAREERQEWMESIGEHTEAVRSLRRSLDRPVVSDGGQAANNKDGAVHRSE